MLDRPVPSSASRPRGIQRVTGRAVVDAGAAGRSCASLREADDTIQRRDAVRVQAVAPVVVTVLELPPAADGARARRPR